MEVELEGCGRSWGNNYKKQQICPENLFEINCWAEFETGSLNEAVAQGFFKFVQFRSMKQS